MLLCCYVVSCFLFAVICCCLSLFAVVCCRLLFVLVLVLLVVRLLLYWLVLFTSPFCSSQTRHHHVRRIFDLINTVMIIKGGEQISSLLERRFQSNAPWICLLDVPGLYFEFPDVHLFLTKGICYFKDSVVTWNCLFKMLGKSKKYVHKWWFDVDESHGRKQQITLNTYKRHGCSANPKILKSYKQTLVPWF